jgi:hypothetical protein
VVRLWISLAVVKTVMGYYQMPMMLKILKRVSSREMSKGEVAQMIFMSPLVNMLALPHYLLREGWRFFEPYDEAYVEKKFKEMGPF